VSIDSPDELMRRLGDLQVAAAEDTIKDLRAEVERLKAFARDDAELREEDCPFCERQVGGIVPCGFHVQLGVSFDTTRNAEARAEAAEKAMEEQDAAVDFIGSVACGMAFESGRIEVMNEHARTHSVCAFCGAESPRTPEAMETHARSCEKHPLFSALARAETAERTLEASRAAGQLTAKTATELERARIREGLEKLDRYDLKGARPDNYIGLLSDGDYIDRDDALALVKP
jgi:hypothetical protein